MADSCRRKSYSKGDLIFQVGEPCNAFYIVAEGQVRLFASSPSGQEKVIEITLPGQSFGEAMVFLDRPYIVNAQALNKTVVIEVDKDGIRNEIKRNPDLAMHMLASISQRMHALVQDVENYALSNGLQRLIGFLLRDVELETTGPAIAHTVLLPASKATIASRLSLTPEYFSRVLHELSTKQLIRIDRREVHIFDVQKLASYSSR